MSVSPFIPPVAADALATLQTLAPDRIRAGLLPSDWDELARRYGERHRRYHTLDHLVEVARTLRVVPLDHPDEIFCTILFHDAIYRPLRKDNEARSAALARAVLGARMSPGELDIDAVARLIQLTAEHGRLRPGEVRDDEAAFLDADMAVLGAAPARYAAYAAGVEHEYRVLPGFVYRRGRRAFVAGLLERPRIFLTEEFHSALDQGARANLRAELAALVS